MLVILEPPGPVAGTGLWCLKSSKFERFGAWDYRLSVLGFGA